MTLKEKPEDDSILLGTVPVCQTNLTGPGLSLVKIHYLEGSTVMGQSNEFLFVISLEKY